MDRAILELRIPPPWDFASRKVGGLGRVLSGYYVVTLDRSQLTTVAARYKSTSGGGRAASSTSPCAGPPRFG